MTTNLPNFSANKYKFPIIGYTFEVAGRTEYSSTLLNESQRALIREEMSTWEAISAASFVEVPNSLPVGLYIGIDTISDGPNGILASVTDSFYPTAFDTGLLETDINPPEYKSFRIDPADINSSIISATILHEIGHVLGLSHRTDVESIMGPFVGQGLRRSTIQQADIDLVQRLYGLPDEEDVAGEFSSAKNIAVNSTTTGFHHAGDELDIYSVTLRQNKEYTIDLKGASTGSGTMSNPYMELFQEPASGSNNLQYITFGLLGGVGGDDQITYTPSTSGTFYIYSKSVNSPLFNNGETGSYTLSITSPNTAPVALNDAASATAGQAVTINIGANDSDADGDNLTTTGVTGPTKGTVRYTDNLSSADTVRYTPFSTATGTDSFTYQVSDGNGGTDTARVTITISAPDQSADTSTTGRISVGESVTGELSLSPFDPDDWFAIRLLASKNYIFNLEGSPTGKGTATDTFLGLYGPTGNFIQENDNSGVGLNARLSYTPQETGTYYIAARYTLLNDGDFGEGTGLGTYTLSAALNNRSPVAGNDTATATAGQSVTINIGANDSDPDGDNLTTTGLTDPAKGTVRYTDNFTTSDTVTYTPFSTATGTDSFTYQVND